MSTGMHTTNGRAARSSTITNVRGASRRLEPTAERRASPLLERLEFAMVFAETVGVYLVRVLPQARNELKRWEARVDAIPAAQLRDAAQSAMSKRGNIEGAALFATLAPVAFRRQTVRAQVAFQTAYNYVDALSEQACENPAANADQLHQALLCALHPGVEPIDYYEHYRGDDDDGGFLTDLVNACRDAVSELPNFPTLGPLAREAAGRIVDFQVLSLPRQDGAHAALKSWGDGLAAGTGGVYWWEAAAGAGSSLAVHALIASAAGPVLGIHDARTIACAYYPWAGAAHSLLDSLVDRREDEQNGQRSLLDYYAVPAHVAEGLSVLASRAYQQAGKVADADQHRVILTAMCSYYLSAPECHTREARTITRSLRNVLGIPLNAAIWMFRIKRLAHALTGNPYI